MRLDPNPIYRKEIIPWYDSEVAGLIVVVFMIVSLLFGTVGIVVARQNPIYHGYTWVPVLVVALSGGVVVSMAVRMLRRYLRRTAE